jgi:hypothetical protein
MLLKQFIIKTGLLVFITSGLCFAIFKIFFPNDLIILYLLLPVLFGLINVLVFYTLSKEKDLSILKFSNRYMLCTTLKLLGSIILIVVFLFFYRNRAIPFLATFLAIYLIFLVQEIIGILKYFKKK